MSSTFKDFQFPQSENFLAQLSHDALRENYLDQRAPQMNDFLKRMVDKYCLPGGNILDVGCGSGSDSALLISMGHKVVSCDILEDMLTIVKSHKEYMLQKGDKRFEGWEIFQGNIISLEQTVEDNPHLPQQYDCITCFGGVILNLDDDDIRKAFTNLYSLLKPGGALILDHRSFRSAIERGYFNNNGILPFNVTAYLENETGFAYVKPYVLYGPAPERKPIVVINEYHRNNGDTSLLPQNPLTSSRVVSMAKEAFGVECNISVFHDLQSETELAEIDACFTFYIIERSSKQK